MLEAIATALAVNAAKGLLERGMSSPQAMPNKQPVMGNPQAAMRFMPNIPMATFNPGQMGGGIFDDQDLMMMMQQAPPRGLLY